VCDATLLEIHWAQLPAFEYRMDIEVRPGLEILANGLDALDGPVLSDQERKCPQGVHSQELGSKTGIGFGIGSELVVNKSHQSWPTGSF
jgi:hypothetical protein